MRDISAKVKTLRTATAKTVLKVSPSTIKAIKEGRIPKGDPLPVAKVAAVQAAKNTSQIIPYCHPLPIDYVGVEFDLKDNSIDIHATVKAVYKTGVEMEALTAASVAALTIYDMTKMLDEDMEISSTVLVSKTGGKSDFRQKSSGLKAAVIVMSDTIAAGKKEDQSGQLIVERLKTEGMEVVDYQIISDDPSGITAAINEFADEKKVDLIVTTGGTGTSPRDNTPQALVELLDREIPGIAETMRAYGQERTPYSMLSRSIAGTRGTTLIIAMPGSKGGVIDSLDAIFPAVAHVFKMLRGANHDTTNK